MKRIALIVFNTLAIVGFVPMIACADGLGIPMSDFPDNVEAGPQLGKLTPTSVEITLHTIEDATAVLDFTGENGATGSAGPSLGTAHLFLLAGLEPETEYSYSLQLDGQPLPEVYRFRTPSADVDAPYTFSVIGDPGSGTESQLAIVAALEAEPPDFLLTTGDNAYLEGQRWQVIHRYLVPFADLLASIPFYPSLGNHDVITANGAPFLEFANLPGNERYYSFRWGNGLFIALDTTQDYGPDSAQVAWLVQALEAQPTTWRFVYFHHPGYSAAPNKTTRLEVRETLSPLFEMYGVDIVFTGHHHDYERTVPIVADEPAGGTGPDYVDPAGPIYIVTGGGGRTLYPNGEDRFTVVSLSVYHAMRVDVDGLRIVVQARDRDNVPFDTFTITKSE